MNKELEKQLWSAADALRGSVSSEKYMLVVIGIFVLRYVSCKYENAFVKIKARFSGIVGWEKLLQDEDILSRYGCSFFIPKYARWDYVASFASSPEIGAKIDQAFSLIEKENEQLRGLFDKNYNDPMYQNKLGKLVSIFSNVTLNEDDTIGKIYEYFLGHFFNKQGQKGGEFYTPKTVVQLLVCLIKPEGKVYDPACGTGGMFIESKNYMKKQKEYKPFNVYGQESMDKVWKLAKINLLLHGFNVRDIHLGSRSASTFVNDQHPTEKFDAALVNPPFNMKVWDDSGKLQKNASYWSWGMPPKNNANYAWLSLVLAKLNRKGRAGVVLANGSLSSLKKEELVIREEFIKNNKVDAIITLPDRLFFTTGIPACLWIFNNNKKHERVLMVNGSRLKGKDLSKKLRELTDVEINKLADLYQQHKDGKRVEEIGFAKSVTNSEIVAEDYSFMPGRYVGWKNPVSISISEAKAKVKKLAGELNVLLAQFKKLIPELEVSIKKQSEDDKDKEK